MSYNPEVVASLCSDLMDLQHERMYAIKAQQKLDRAVEGEIRKHLGFRSVDDEGESAPEEERKRLSETARNIKAAIEKLIDGAIKADTDPLDTIETAIEAGKFPLKGQERIASRVRFLVNRNYLSRRPWDKWLDDQKKTMTSIAAELPGADFVRGVRGMATLLGFAVIIGETGDLSTYPDEPKKHGYACVWKRLGLAVMRGRRQGSPGPKATAVEWTEDGYSGQRRAQAWAFLDDVMVRNQWVGDRDENGNACSKTKKPVAVPAHALGPYGEIYGRSKMRYAALNAEGAYAASAAEILASLKAKKKNIAKAYREMLEGGCLSPKHIDNKARRNAAKAFLRDLWKAWRTDMGLPIDRQPPLADAAD